ncbi:DMT family transporter [Sneathiella chinensis]|uniref:Membrane protein n=1 Tax=Sneathiella chinensis TaxID=349750 RepID=A0ABQ5U3I5_9PROT|nr:DMT family transporter [Sneathiella chinensis]GLQ06720.1 membrane protein [Sneathiella chinensis]
MEAWILITIFAAFFQNVRTAIQKYLKDRLSTGGATYVRFLYGFPFAVIYVAVLHWGWGYDLPPLNWTFAGYVVLGGLAQILGTALLVALFSLRNFAVGTTYSKTETVQAALFGIVLLGDSLSWSAVVAIAISMVGILLISMSGGRLTVREFFLAWTGKSAILGILSGGLFGVCAVAYRAASLSLESDMLVVAAAVSIVCVLAFQSLVMTLYISLVEPNQLRKVARAWRPATMVGAASLLGSIGWFTAMAWQNAAYVRAVGQIELVFTFMISIFYFKEKTTRLEAMGVLLVVGGILVFVLK